MNEPVRSNRNQYIESRSLLPFAQRPTKRFSAGSCAGPTTGLCRPLLRVGPVFSTFRDWTCLFLLQIGPELFRRKRGRLVVQDRVSVEHVVLRDVVSRVALWAEGAVILGRNVLRRAPFTATFAPRQARAASHVVAPMGEGRPRLVKMRSALKSVA